MMGVMCGIERAPLRDTQEECLAHNSYLSTGCSLSNPRAKRMRDRMEEERGPGRCIAIPSDEESGMRVVRRNGSMKVRRRSRVFVLEDMSWDLRNVRSRSGLSHDEQYR